MQQSRAWTAPLGNHGSGIGWGQRGTKGRQLEPEEDAPGTRALEAQGGPGRFCSPSSQLTLEEKHHQLEQPPLLPGSQAPPEHMEPARREHEERAAGLRHRRRGGCHSCSHPRAAHGASGASEAARRQRLGFTPNLAALPGMLQRCPILLTSVPVVDSEHVGWEPEPGPLAGHHSGTRHLSRWDRAPWGYWNPKRPAGMLHTGMPDTPPDTVWRNPQPCPSSSSCLLLSTPQTSTLHLH